jgi:N-methylhydantoinase A/oxoprolinase/acetone carboxylase beta subunit
MVYTEDNNLTIMTRREEYDQWVIDWITAEKAKGRKCFDVKKISNSYYVYYQTTRYNAETKRREKVSAYMGKLDENAGLLESRSEQKDEISPVRYGIGIDTGGTFTDAVVIDLEDMSVIAKGISPTTHEDLSIGLYNSLDKALAAADIDLSQIARVGISTTLATNSVLEGRGGEVGLILIGWDPMNPVTFGEKNQIFIQGGYDVRGKAINSLSLEEATAAIEKVSQGVDSIAISGLFANLNSSQEVKIKDLVQKLTGLPTVAGHELSAELGIGLRAETAVLNAKLIPVISKFFDEVQKTFREKGINAPIMVYKGDGSVMTIDQAKLYPVQTILSGPAASAMGGKMLSGKEDCVIVDIGGTSTDIAMVESGYPQIQFMGAEVGGWRTRVKAVDMYTVGLGGDSRITIDGSKFKFGPMKTVPLCIFCESHPETVNKIVSTNLFEFYSTIENADETDVTERESRILTGMRGKGAMSIMEVMNATKGLWDIADDMLDMVRKRVVAMASLTPTDLMVSMGFFESGNTAAAKAGIHAVSERLGMTDKQASTIMMEELKVNVSEAVLTKLINDSLGSNWQNRETMMFLRRMASSSRNSNFEMMPKLKVPIVGIGAPAKIIMDDIGEMLGTEAIFPENFDVGNAVGAICSKVVESLSATITPTNDYRFKLEVPYIGPSYYYKIDGAVSAAKSSLESFLLEAISKHNGKDPVTTFKVKTFMATEGGVGNWEEEGLARTVNYIEVNARTVADPPEGI